MENGPFEDVLPIENGDVPASYVSLPEGNGMSCQGFNVAVALIPSPFSGQLLSMVFVNFLAWQEEGMKGVKAPQITQLSREKRYQSLFPGDAIRDLTLSRSLEVTIHLSKGHVFKITKRAPSELPG